MGTKLGLKRARPSGDTKRATRDRFRTLEDVAAIVQRFEHAQLHPHEWNHEVHLVVAAWYLSVFSRSEGTAHVIEGIGRLNQAHGVRSTPTTGYHQTITMFWLAAVQHTLQGSTQPTTEILARVREVIAACGHRRSLLLDYYDKEELSSEKARASWVPPRRFPRGDLTPLSEMLMTVEFGKARC